MSKINPRCTHTPGCFACTNGSCRILKDTNFGDKACPFYKTQEQAEADNRRARERLVAEGRYDLIEKYYLASGGENDGC